MLDVKLIFDASEAIQTPGLATWVFESPSGEPLLEDVLAALDQRTGRLLRELAASGELKGKAGETLLLHRPRGLQAQRLLLLGAGKREKFTLAAMRSLAGTAARLLQGRSVTEFTYLLRLSPSGLDAVGAAQAAVEGVFLASFDPATYRTEKKDAKVITSMALAGLPAEQRSALTEAVRRGRIIGQAQNLARTLANEPSNRLTPRVFGERAAALARETGLEADILDEKRIRELKMGGLLSVAQGSDEPPRLVVLTYTPSGWKQGRPVLGLVGKGITFDSGGISIKPSEGMEKMKYDMAGGATMVGAMRAVAELKPTHKVIAVVPLSENLPGGRAQKPGDVQIAMSGKSIEVVNTDAEGRLVLADALHYARQLGATHLVDAATLTGAVVVALGHVNVGAFSNDQKFLDAVLASARAVGEKFWPLPLDEDYRDNIKSAIADIQNVGKGRGGGAINGALFLAEFVGDTPWVHLDIAGTAWLEEAKPEMPKGPTGVAVRTLVHLVENFSS
ncbi:MAG: leucyl aminopeptidase [Terriglobia bacterium]